MTQGGETGGKAPRERFPRSARIRRSTEIIELLRTGKRARFGPLEVFHHRGVQDLPSLGIIVPKHRHKIVARNQLKRRIRELGRRELLPALAACAPSVRVLVRARPEAYEASFDELRAALARFTEELCSGVSHSG